MRTLFLAFAALIVPCLQSPAMQEVEELGSETPPVNLAESEECVEPPSKMLVDASEGQTRIVATLDAPLDRACNAVWCASMPLLWSHMVNEINHGPIVLEGEPAEAARLNAAPDPSKDIPESCYYVDAGTVEEGVADRIGASMHRRFPDASIPDFSNADPGSIIGYAYMNAKAKFAVPYNWSSLSWRSRGVLNMSRTKVNSFGFTESDYVAEDDTKAYRKLRKQPSLLYWKTDASGKVVDCAIDLDRTSPIQVVVAYMKGKGTLQEMLDRVEAKAAAVPKRFGYHDMRSDDVLKVPVVHCEFLNQNENLINRPILSGSMKGRLISDLTQKTKFTLNENGAKVESDVIFLSPFGVSNGSAKPPRRFVFDRPFLVYMKERNANAPFFVLWVRNTDLLTIIK